jgi:lipid A 3-O-deacylase
MYASGEAESLHQMIRVVIVVTTIFLAAAAPIRAEDRPFEKGNRTRGMVGGWGIGYQPLWAPTRSDVGFAAVHPRMGWFVEDRTELYGEATLFLYAADITAGVGALAGRYYLRTAGRWIPYVHGGVGLLWTSLDVLEIDRTFNFQHFIGVGWRQHRVRGPRLVFELRNHHISNAGTAGDNLGVNAIVALTGVEWILK